MPIDRWVDERGFRWDRWHGPVTLDDLSTHFMAAAHYPDELRFGRVLGEATESVLLFTGRDMMTRMRPLLDSKDFPRPLRMAVVVRTLEQRGVANQFSVYAESIGFVKLFEDRDEGIRWLLSNEP
jgi:hypothetical protein